MFGVVSIAPPRIGALHDCQRKRRVAPLEAASDASDMSPEATSYQTCYGRTTALNHYQSAAWEIGELHKLDSIQKICRFCGLFLWRKPNRIRSLGEKFSMAALRAQLSDSRRRDINGFGGLWREIRGLLYVGCRSSACRCCRLAARQDDRRTSRTHCQCALERYGSRRADLRSRLVR
jgi:hypothetical protein